MLTLTEWAKLNPTPLTAGVVEVFARTNPILELLPFQNIAGSAYATNRELTLPGVAFRDINEAYTESTGTVEPITERIRFMGGDSDYDVALVKMGTGDNNTRATHDALKVKAMAYGHLAAFLRGDSAVNTKEFDGIYKRVDAGQVVSAGTNGGALSLSMLDELLDAIDGEGAGVLLMNKKTRRALTELARNTSSLSVSQDEFGRQQAVYAGVPIRILDRDASGAQLLPFTETQGSATDTTSVWAVRFGADGVHGIQTEPVNVRDLGEIEAKPAFRTRVEHYSSFLVKKPAALARLKGLH